MNCSKFSEIEKEAKKKPGVQTGFLKNVSKLWDIYYQKITNLGKTFREFHNWVKSVITDSYCGPAKENMDGKNKKKTVRGKK